MRAKNVNVKFGKFDTDIILTYTLSIDFRLGTKSQFYDELHMVTTMQLTTDNDIMNFKIIKHKLDVMNKYSETEYPVRNEVSISTNEYREFLASFEMTMEKVKNWLNQNVLRNGIHFPYAVDEIKTDFKFQEGSAHIFM